MKKIKIIITLLLIIFSTSLAVHLRFNLGHDKIFTHLFYVPIILAAFWWQYSVIAVISAITLFILGADYLSGKMDMFQYDLIRSFFFFAVGLSVAYLRKLQKSQFQLKIYRDILYSMQEAVVIIDRSYNIILTNYAFDKIFNNQSGEVRDIYSLLDDEQQMKEFSENALRSFCGESVILGIYLNGAGKDGGYYNISFYPLKDESGIDNLILSFRDVNDQIRSEMLQKKATEKQKLSIDLLEYINRKKNDPDLISDILLLISERTGIDAMIINLKSGKHYQRFKKELYPSRQMDLDEDVVEESDVIDFEKPVIPGFDTEVCSMLAGDTLFWTNNLRECCSISGAGSPCGASLMKFSSCAVIPLKKDANIAGYFMMIDRRDDFFDDELIAYFQGIVESIEIAMNRVEYELNLENMVDEKELLIKEVHHRVKNNMQVIISLISLQASRQSDDQVREILNECQNRVRTMALVHEKLYSSDNFKSINMNAYIKSLAPMLMSSYRLDKNRIHVLIDATDIFFRLDIAIPLAQLLNEILSNVFKHAFKNDTEGEVVISLSPDPDRRKGFILSIADNGVGFSGAVNFPGGGNLGFQLIDALVKQLRGLISFSGGNGVSVSVSFKDSL